MRIVNLDQNSEDWLLWRQAGLGASDAPILLGISPWKSPEDLWREKRTALQARCRGKLWRGWDDETPAMRRGKELEPEARKLFEMLTGLSLTPVCGVHDDHDWLRASLDGFDREQILEIKCPNGNSHRQALAGEVPDHYRPQLLHQCLVAGENRVLYWSYSPDREFRGPDRGALVVFEASQKELDVYLQAASEFWHSVLNGEPVLGGVG